MESLPPLPRVNPRADSHGPSTVVFIRPTNGSSPNSALMPAETSPEQSISVRENPPIA
ncbi:Uncharacterised protein [Mycobacteroides abscessus subsp. abscessus]|nr:Uncharacterised protein [Mycobacteroides abscessus subsp. abscessus]